MDNEQLVKELNQLISENQNPDTMDIDLLSTLDIVTKINHQDEQVAQAISLVLPQIAQVVDNIVSCFKNGGRLVYIGAGTSGRLGILDAVECIPTFGIDEGLIIAIMAGGDSAMFKAKEGVEDDKAQGIAAVKEVQLCKKDILIGIAASGRTPYVIGALEFAKSIGCITVALSSNPNAQIAEVAEHAILPVVGPEPLTGSTRMKSGTAQKMVLNILSTASMIRMGKSYKNLMVDLKATNKKLYARGTRMIMQVTGVSQSEAETALEQSKLQVKVAILMLLANVNVEQAQSMLVNSDGFLRAALQ